MNNRPILITGCARSGTSMVAGIINLCGIFGGIMSGPTPNNKKGMFENARIRNEVVKQYLISIGSDPLGQKPLPPDIYTGFPIPDLRNRILEILDGQGRNGKRWFYKGAKMCLIWKHWHDAFPEAQWIIVRRPDEQIADSCMRASFMRAYHDVSGWMKWIEYHKRRWEEMKKSADCTEIWSDRIVKGDFSELKKALAHLDLEWTDRVIDFVEPVLYNIK